jgi:hypothetical protein
MYCHEFIGDDAAAYAAVMKRTRAEDSQLEMFKEG